MKGKTLISCLGVLVCLPMGTLAQFNYTTSGGTATIEQYTGPGGVVVVPSTLNDYTVVSIGPGAFAFTSVTTVIIPNTVNNVGSQAFNGCTALTSVSMPGSVTAISSETFEGCSALSEFTIPSSVTSIGDYAFAGCALTNISLPSGLTDIGAYAFELCLLTSVLVPDSVTNIGQVPFYGCARLTSITVLENNPSYSSFNGVLFDKNRTTLLDFPPGNSSHYTIPNGVTTIGSRAFGSCQKLATVVVPASVETIEDTAFYSCFNLVSVSFFGNAPFFGDYVFDRDPATIFYYSGTAGWLSSYDGISAIELATFPHITGNGQINSKAGSFGFTITGSAGQTILIEASTNLVNWLPVATNGLAGASTNFSDPEALNYKARFYRVRAY